MVRQIYIRGQPNIPQVKPAEKHRKSPGRGHVALHCGERRLGDGQEGRGLGLDVDSHPLKGSVRNGRSWGLVAAMINLAQCGDHAPGSFP